MLVDLLPPPGANVDYSSTNPQERAAIAVSSVFVGIAVLFTGVRIYAKTCIFKKVSWDDLTFALSVLCTIAMWIVVLLHTIKEGTGQHIWNIPLSTLVSDSNLILSYLTSWLPNVAFGITKATLLIFFWNLFKPFRWLRITIIIGGIAVVGVYAGLTLAALIGTTPRRGQTWLESTANPGFAIGVTLAVPLGAWTLASDVFLFLLPISGVARLHISAKKKIGVFLTFMAGLGACICSALSLYYRTYISKPDLTYYSSKVEVLTVVELCVGLCIACVPSASATLRRIFPSVKSHLSKSRSKYPSSSSQGRTPKVDSKHSWSSSDSYHQIRKGEGYRTVGVPPIPMVHIRAGQMGQAYGERQRLSVVEYRDEESLFLDDDVLGRNVQRRDEQMWDHTMARNVF